MKAKQVSISLPGDLAKRVVVVAKQRHEKFSEFLKYAVIERLQKLKDVKSLSGIADSDNVSKSIPNNKLTK